MTKRAGAETYPNYTHQAPRMLMEDAPLTSATALAPHLTTPYLGIYGEHAMKDTGPLTVRFWEKASEPKDIDANVDQAVAKMDEFSKKHAG